LGSVAGAENRIYIPDLETRERGGGDEGGRTLDDPRKIEKLDLGSLVADDTRNASERGELVGCGL
jgi:hypothetical protein